MENPGAPPSFRSLFPPAYLVFTGIGVALVLQGWAPKTFGFVENLFLPFDPNGPLGQSLFKLKLAWTQCIAFGLTAFFFVGGLKPLALRFVNFRFFILAFLLSLVALPAIQFMALDADSFALPEALAELEKTLESFEKEAETLIIKLLAHDLALNLFVVALIPGVMEELFFRGFVQKTLQKSLSPHVSVWLSAFLFSLIHFQVYGFLPRMVLGAIYGYLYLWSESLLPAICAHFFNNALNVVAVYYALDGQIEKRWVRDTQVVPAWLAALSLILSAGILYFYHQTAQKYLCPKPENE